MGYQNGVNRHGANPLKLNAKGDIENKVCDKAVYVITDQVKCHGGYQKCANKSHQSDDRCLQGLSLGGLYGQYGDDTC